VLGVKVQSGAVTMTLIDLLVQEKSAIVDRWRDLIIRTYPPHTSDFLKRQHDRFCNPVGHAISNVTEKLYQILLDGLSTDRVCEVTDEIIRIRAVQDFSASDAVAFVFLLKKAIRVQLENELRHDSVAIELLSFESRIDALALLVFDAYMRCREKIHEIKVSEIKNRIPQRAVMRE
jgi:hypothetical protein